MSLPESDAIDFVPERIAPARSISSPSALYLDPTSCRLLLENLGPSLALWRAAEIAILRQQQFVHPILDAGCGDGFLSKFILESIDAGLDPDSRVLQRASMLGIYRELIGSSIEEYKLDGNFATVISNSVMEHLQHPDSALHAVHSLLRPGGRFVFTVPSKDFSKWLALPLPAYAKWRNQKLIHRNLWSAQEWKRRLQAAGFEVLAIRPYLKRSLVFIWDVLELAQLVYVGRKRVFSLLWHRLPSTVLDRLARRLSAVDFSAEEQGGGLLIVARK